MSTETSDRAETERVIRELYAALARRDHVAVAALYAADTQFSDPAFGDLRGDEVRAMWWMLSEAATDLEVTLGEVTALGDRGAATWEARYTFSETGRRVHNVVEAHIRVSGGRITRHDDHFDLWRWSRQALGPLGTALGWTPLMRPLVQRRARRRLDAFLAAHDQPSSPG